MNRNELENRLNHDGIRKDTYDLWGDKKSETYVMDYINGRFHVYYYERGLETSKIEFTSENEACEYFLNLLKNDKTTHT